MKNNLSRRNFLRKSSAGLTGFVFITAAGIPFSLVASNPKSSGDQSPVSKTGCEFGVEGSAPHEAKAFDLLMKAASDLGAGFKIAALDLELRGAGNLLGGQQSGHIEAVGFELYTTMLERTVRELFEAFIGATTPDRPDRAALTDNPLIPFGGVDR